jgi:hypothetical protein
MAVSDEAKPKVTLTPEMKQILLEHAALVRDRWAFSKSLRDATLQAKAEKRKEGEMSEPEILYGSVPDFTARKPELKKDPKGGKEVLAPESDVDFAKYYQFVLMTYPVFSSYEITSASPLEKEMTEAECQEAREQRLLKLMYNTVRRSAGLVELLHEYIHNVKELDYQWRSTFEQMKETKGLPPEELEKKLKGSMAALFISTLQKLIDDGMVKVDGPDSYSLTPKGEQEAQKEWPTKNELFRVWNW